MTPLHILVLLDMGRQFSACRGTWCALTPSNRDQGTAQKDNR